MPYAPKPNIPGYELTEKIGQGGMGTVWKAVQKSLNRTVAIKVLAAHLVNDPKYLERFAREIHAAAKLTHPNIVQIFEADHVNGLHYFVMEYVDGRPLRRRLTEMGRLPEKEAFNIALQIANALDYAWNTARLIHRDIKPDNILLTRKGDAKLTDLGLVRTAHTEEDAEMVRAGMTVGTPNYIAPEQAQGLLDVDTRADLYSLGATLFQLLTGRLPYPLETSSRVMSAHVHEPLPNPQEINPHLTDAACAIVEKLMAKEPADRYQTGVELVDEIERFLNGQTPLALVAKNPPPKKRNTKRLVAVGVVAIAFLALAMFNWHYSRLEQRIKAESKRLRLAQSADPEAPRRALDVAVLYIEQHPDQYADTLDFLNDLSPQVAGTTYDNALRQLIDETLRRREAAATAILARLEAEAQALTDAEKFTDAIAVFEAFPADFKETRTADKIAAVQTAIQRAAQQRLAQLTTAIQDAIKENRLDDARQFIADIERVQAPQVHSLLNMLRAELEKGTALIPVRPSTDPTPQALYDQLFLPDFEKAIRARRFAQAIALCESWLAVPERAPLHPKIEAHARESRLLEKLLRAASAAAPFLKDERLRIGDHFGVVFKVTAESIVLRSDEGIENSFLIEDLPAESIVAIARRPAENAHSADLAFASGLLLWQEGDITGARTQFEAASKFGADTKDYLQRIAAAEKIQREIAAAVAIESLKALVEKQQWVEAREKFAEVLQTFAATDAFKTTHTELDALAPKIAAAANRVDIEAHAESCRDLVTEHNGHILTVNPNGGADFKTIQDALARATDGDGIELSDGVYDEWNLTSTARGLLIFGKSGATPVFSARKMPRELPMFEPASGWVFDNIFFDLRPTTAVPRPVALQISNRAALRLRHCALIGNGALIRQNGAATIVMEDCFMGFGVQSGLPEAHELSLTMQHCTFVRAAPLLELRTERETECSIKFWENVLIGSFAALAEPWRERKEVPRTVIYYGDYNLFLSHSVEGKFDFSDKNNVLPPKPDAFNRLYLYDDWARLFELDHASQGFISPKPATENEPPMKRYGALFVAPLEGDFRLQRDHVIPGSDQLPAGVRWAQWQWQEFQKKFRALELK